MAPKRKASGGASPGPASPDTKKTQQSAEARAGQKLREVFGHLTMEEKEILTSPLSGLTLRQQVIEDCRLEDSGGYVRWEKATLSRELTSSEVPTAPSPC